MTDSDSPFSSAYQRACRGPVPDDEMSAPARGKRMSAKQQEIYDSAFDAGYRAGRVDGVTAFLQQHAPSCAYHLDQYPWECTCKAPTQRPQPITAPTPSPPALHTTRDNARLIEEPKG